MTAIGASVGRQRVTAIVLAGGRSSRFGTDKLAVELDGRPLLHHALAAVAEVADAILLVVTPGSELAIPEELGARTRIVEDPAAFGGPLVGLVAALATVAGGTALVVGGDMPRMVPAVLRRLISGLEPPRRAVVLEVPGRFQPLPMVLEVVAGLVAGRLVLSRGGRSLRDFLRELGSASIPAPVWLALDPAGATVTDIDRPSDLRS